MPEQFFTEPQKQFFVLLEQLRNEPFLSTAKLLKSSLATGGDFLSIQIAQKAKAAHSDDPALAKNIQAIFIDPIEKRAQAVIEHKPFAAVWNGIAHFFPQAGLEPMGPGSSAVLAELSQKTKAASEQYRRDIMPDLKPENLLQGQSKDSENIFARNFPTVVYITHDQFSLADHLLRCIKALPGVRDSDKVKELETLFKNSFLSQKELNEANAKIEAKSSRNEEPKDAAPIWFKLPEAVWKSMLQEIWALQKSDRHFKPLVAKWKKDVYPAFGDAIAGLAAEGKLAKLLGSRQMAEALLIACGRTDTNKTLADSLRTKLNLLPPDTFGNTETLVSKLEELGSNKETIKELVALLGSNPGRSASR